MPFTARRPTPSASKANSQPGFLQDCPAMSSPDVGRARCPPHTIRWPGRRPARGCRSASGQAQCISRATAFCAVGHGYAAAASIAAGRTVAPAAATPRHLAAARSAAVGCRAVGLGNGARRVPDDARLGCGTPPRGRRRAIAPLIGVRVLALRYAAAVAFSPSRMADRSRLALPEVRHLEPGGTATSRSLHWQGDLPVPRSRPMLRRPTRQPYGPRWNNASGRWS